MKKLPVYKGHVNLLEDSEELYKYIRSIDPGELLVNDWETTGLEHDALPLGLSLCARDKPPIFAPTDYYFTDGMPMTEIADVCNECYPDYKLIAHNAKYDSMINVMNGIKDECCNWYADTLIMVHLVDPNLDMNLEKRVAADFGYEKQKFEKLCGKRWNKINWASEGDALLPILAAYAGEDTYWELKVYEKYRPLMNPRMWKMLQDMEMPLVKILRDAKIRGVVIDVPLLKEMGVEVDKRLSQYIQEIYDECGCVFNINSTPQKQKVFFEKMDLPVISTTKTGGPSTDAKTAASWAESGYRIGELLVKYSELQKLNSGYIKSIPNLVDKHNVLRGDLNSCGTVTSRFSSSNPNLQNQPNNHDFPIRQAFIPRPGYCFLNYDYSQLELRVMAHMAPDPVFKKIFWSGGDPHAETAQLLNTTRRNAKTCNFGVLYGLGIPNFARRFKTTNAEAQKIIDRYHDTYYGYAKWKVRTEEFVQKHGYVETLFGFRRLLPEAMKSPFKRTPYAFYEALRQACNTIIQGTGAGIVKLATIAAVKSFKKAGLDCHFLLQVHDELLFEVRIDQALEAERLLIDAMENTVKLDVPLTVDGKILANWGEMKDDDIPSLPYRFDYSLYASLL